MRNGKHRDGCERNQRAGTNLANHSLVLSLETEDVVVKHLPRLAQRRMVVVHDMDETLVKRGLRGGLLVEVARAVLAAVDVAALQRVEAVHRDDELTTKLA